MIENRKAIAPIPAVGAAGEQSHGSKTKNIITEKSGEEFTTCGISILKPGYFEVLG